MSKGTMSTDPIRQTRQTRQTRQSMPTTKTTEPETRAEETMSMRTPLRFALALAAAGLLTLSSSLARADGVMLAPSALDAKARVALEAAIKHDKTKNAAAFAEVAKARAELADLDAQKRGRLAALTPRLKALGPSAVLAMLNELAFDAKGKGALTDTAWQAWKLGLLEASSMLRDARSEPVYVAVLEGAESDAALVKAASEALARLSTDTAASKLVALSKKTGAKQVSIVTGMGHCRRAVVADHLASMLAGASDADLVKGLARALGDVGSAWAWKTTTVQQAAPGEEAKTRLAAAKALVDAYATAPTAARDMLMKAVLVVDHPQTGALVASAKKSASASGQKLLDELLAKFQASPLHK